MMIDVTKFEMPILKGSRLSGFPKSVDLPMSCESQAKQNCGSQSFARLRERGGVSPDEAVAFVEMREWRPMTIVELVDAFRRHGWLACDSETVRLRELVKELEEQQQEAKCEHLNRMEQIGFLMGSLYGLKARVDDETLECIAKIIAHAAGNYKLPLPVSIELQRSEDA